MKVFKLNGKTYYLEAEIRSALPNVSFPHFTSNNLERVCSLLGVEVEDVPDPEVPDSKSVDFALDMKKLERDSAVRSIVVEVDGMKFDGDEVAQGRMARALKVAELNNLEKTAWVLADNTVVEVTKKQLEEALTKAMLQQATLWTKPYEDSDNEAS